MKATFYLLTIIFFSICFVACEKDNLDIAPNATFGGEIRDMETGELVEQEIIRGSQIYFIELGWDNPPVQAMAVKNDGTFQNNLMFAGDYKIILNKGNYIPQDTIDFRINKGKNYKVFEVLPYIRIVNPDIRYKGNKVVAKFSLQQYTVDPVNTIALFAHTESHVSSNIQTAKVSSEINIAVSPLTEYELSMDLSQTTGIEREHSYFFRIGALSSTSEAKYNYSPAVEIDL